MRIMTPCRATPIKGGPGWAYVLWLAVVFSYHVQRGLDISALLILTTNWTFFTQLNLAYEVFAEHYTTFKEYWDLCSCRQ